MASNKFIYNSMTKASVMEIEIVFSRVFIVRRFVAIKLMQLASFILGCSVVVKNKTVEDE